MSPADSETEARLKALERHPSGEQPVATVDEGTKITLKVVIAIVGAVVVAAFALGGVVWNANASAEEAKAARIDALTAQKSAADAKAAVADLRGDLAVIKAVNDTQHAEMTAALKRIEEKLDSKK